MRNPFAAVCSRAPICAGPYSRQTVAKMFEGVPAAERRQITYGNKAKLYGIKATA